MIEEIIKLIKSDKWHITSCGRSTEYFEEFQLEDSKKELIRLIGEIK